MSDNLQWALAASWPEAVVKLHMYVAMWCDNCCQVSCQYSSPDTASTLLNTCIGDRIGRSCLGRLTQADSADLKLQWLRCLSCCASLVCEPSSLADSVLVGTYTRILQLQSCCLQEYIPVSQTIHYVGTIYNQILCCHLWILANCIFCIQYGTYPCQEGYNGRHIPLGRDASYIVIFYTILKTADHSSLLDHHITAWIYSTILICFPL